jgi:hypothetical protein
MFTPITTAITKIINACTSPLIPPVNDFPSTIEVLGIGEHKSLSSCPKSLSQIIDIPVKIEMKRTDWASMPGVKYAR